MHDCVGYGALCNSPAGVGNRIYYVIEISSDDTKVSAAVVESRISRFDVFSGYTDESEEINGSNKIMPIKSDLNSAASAKIKTLVFSVLICQFSVFFGFPKPTSVSVSVEKPRFR